MSEQSEQIDQLITSLSAAQGQIFGAIKDSTNPFFKSHYADLASVMDAIRKPFSSNGLAYVQTTEIDEQGITVTTMLAHKSGQWIRGKLRMMPKDGTPQGIGSCMTYARRYALSAIAGVAQIDDDGNAASGKTQGIEGAYCGQKVNPRPDLSGVDKGRLESLVRRVADILSQDKQERDIAMNLLDVHDEVKTDEAMYSALADSLAKLSIINKAAYKNLIRMGLTAEKEDIR